MSDKSSTNDIQADDSIEMFQTAAKDLELRKSKSMVFVKDINHIILDNSTWHHLINVLRISPGHFLSVSDGLGNYRIFRAEHHIKSTSSGRLPKAKNTGDPNYNFDNIFIPVTKLRRLLTDSKEVGVGLSLCKADKLEWAVQKLTEVGVDHIWLLLAERSQTGKDGAKVNYERLRKIILEAASQARRPRLCILHELTSLKDAYPEISKMGPVAFAEPGQGQFSSRLCSILIGPEGGWSKEELALSENHISLSDGILRVETAAAISGYLLSTAKGLNAQG